jgi:hypothetical protein
VIADVAMIVTEAVTEDAATAEMEATIADAAMIVT